MATKVTKELIDKMVELYNKIGTYSGVAKELGVSASTCSKYIKAAQVEQKNKIEAAKNFVPFDKEIKPIEEISITWEDCCYLNEEEVREIEELWKEI
jgi:predicted transcriptional regulator